MEAFLTGSHAYGTPRPDSDIDLVIRCDEPTLKFLAAMKDADHNGSPAIKYGRLNLIICTDDHSYNAWRVGTTALGWRKPVAREQACDLFKSICKPQHDKCSE